MVNGWQGRVVCREGGGSGECSVNGEMGKDICPNILQPLLVNIDRRSCYDGGLGLIPVFHNPPNPSEVARTLGYLEEDMTFETHCKQRLTFG